MSKKQAVFIGAVTEWPPNFPVAEWLYLQECPSSDRIIIILRDADGIPITGRKMTPEDALAVSTALADLAALQWNKGSGGHAAGNA